MALAQTYFAPHRRVLACPRCDDRLAVWSSRSFHKHGRRNVALVPRVLRAVPPDVDPKRVEEAVAWIDEHRRGDVCMPDELLPLVASA